MIDINLMAADFDAELNKAKDWNKEKLQERCAGVNAERIKSFLQELTALSDKYEIYIEGCEGCGYPWLTDVHADKHYYNLSYGDDRYEVDGL